LCLQIAIEFDEGENDVELFVAAMQHVITESQDKVLEKATKGHGKFQKVSYGVFKLEDKLKQRIEADNSGDEGDAGGGGGFNVDTNWQVPLGFDGGCNAVGGG
jgi:hypothetical protein